MTLRWVTICVSLAAAAVTVLASAAPSLDLGVDSAAAHLVIDTASGVVAVVAAFLMFARFARSGGLAELLLVAGLVVVATTALGFEAIPGAAAEDRVTRFSTWSAAVGIMLAASLFAFAAFAGRRRIAERRVALAYLGVLLLGATAAIAIVAGALAPHLPRAVALALSPNGRHHPRVVGDAAMLGLTLASAVLYAVAAAAFVRRSERDRDELFGWFGVASALAAFGMLNEFLFPSRFSRWLFIGDFLWISAYVVLLIAAAAEIAAYQRGIARAAVLEERRRLARELHDGLAQELAFISTQTRRLLAAPDSQVRQLDQLAVAAERALDESRSAIRALTRRLDEPLEVSVAQAAEEVAERVGIDLRLKLDADIEAPTDTREALLRIVREALSNTARHSGATHATVTLRGGAGIRLSIADDGAGFEPGTPSDGGFGLVSMRERAQALGGELSISSRPGHGTQVEVVIP